MEWLFKILAAMACAFFVWRIYQTIRSNPDAFSKDKLSKSFLTIGVLTLVLMGGVYIMVMLVRG